MEEEQMEQDFLAAFAGALKIFEQGWLAGKKHGEENIDILEEQIHNLEMASFREKSANG